LKNYPSPKSLEGASITLQQETMDRNKCKVSTGASVRAASTHISPLFARGPPAQGCSHDLSKGRGHTSACHGLDFTAGRGFSASSFLKKNQIQLPNR